jgi:hypothetical protein
MMVVAAPLLHPSRLRELFFNSFHVGAMANPINGIDTAPINNPTPPDRAAIIAHFAGPEANGRA